MQSAMKQKQDASAEQRWRAVRNRDKTFDDSFVYAVLTTGVYCRPSCAARTPRFENVRFFAGNAEAERAGFQALQALSADGGSARRASGRGDHQSLPPDRGVGERLGPCSDRE